MLLSIRLQMLSSVARYKIELIERRTDCEVTRSTTAN